MFFPGLFVKLRDTLLYKARLAMPGAPEADIGAQVDTLMGKLSMISAQHTQVTVRQRAKYWYQHLRRVDHFNTKSSVLFVI